MTTPVNPPIVPNLPPAPLVTDTPEQFDEKAFPFAESLDPWGQSLNALAMATRTNAVAAQEGAVEAKDAAQDARDAANSAASASGAVKWVAGNSYAEGRVVWSQLDGQTYRAKAAVSGNIDPSNDPTNWAQLGVNLAQLYAATLSI